VTTGCLFLDRLMKIRLDRLWFVLGVGVLVIGVGSSVAVIVVGTICRLLDLFGESGARSRKRPRARDIRSTRAMLTMSNVGPAEHPSR
jgi:hypothetical protein